MHRIAAIAISSLLLLGACSNGEAGPSSEPNTTAAAATPAESPTPEVELPEGVNPFPEGIAAQEGQRYAATAFDPVFTFEGQGGMPFPFFGEANDVRVVELHSEESALVFLRPDGVMEPEGEPGELPDDLGAWLEDHPSLDLTRRGDARLAELEGAHLEGGVSKVTEPRPDDCEEPCLPLLTIEGDTMWFPKGRLLVFRTFELSSGPLVVLVDTTRENYETLGPKVDALLRSVEFLPSAGS